MANVTWYKSCHEIYFFSTYVYQSCYTKIKDQRLRKMLLVYVVWVTICHIVFVSQFQFIMYSHDAASFPLETFYHNYDCHCRFPCNISDLENFRCILQRKLWDKETT